MLFRSELTSEDVSGAMQKLSDQATGAMQQIQDIGFKIESTELHVGHGAKAVLHVSDGGTTGKESEVLARNDANRIMKGVLSALIKSRELHMASQPVSGIEVTLGLVPGVKLEFGGKMPVTTTAANSAKGLMALKKSDALGLFEEFRSSHILCCSIKGVDIVKVTELSKNSIELEGQATVDGDNRGIRYTITDILSDYTVSKLEIKGVDGNWFTDFPK